MKKSLQKAISLAKVQQANDEFVSLPGPETLPEMETYSESISRLTPVPRSEDDQKVVEAGQRKGVQGLLAPFRMERLRWL